MGGMPIEEVVGESLFTVEEFLVEAGKVAEYANSTRNDNSVHQESREAIKRGFEAIPAPLTFTATKRFPRYRPPDVADHWGIDLGFDPAKTVHGEKRYEFGRVVLVGDEFTGETTLEEVYQRNGKRGGEMTFAVLATKFTDADDEWVLTERSTLIETENTGSKYNSRGVPDSKDDSRGVPDSEDISRPTDRRVDAENIQADDTAPMFEISSITRRDFVKYAGASGDFNRLHFDEPYAKRSGHKRVFGQGMFSASIVAQVVADWFGIANVTALRMRFQSKLFPGDAIETVGEVTEIESSHRGVDVTAKIDLVTSDGRRIIKGIADAAIPYQC